MGAERQELTTEQFIKHIPSLSTGQVEQFREKRSTDDTHPLDTFIKNLKTLPPTYRELFTRRAFNGILIEGEPLDLSGLDITPKK